MEWRFFKEPNAHNEFYEIRNQSQLVGYFVLKISNYTVIIEDFLVFKNRKLIQKSFFELMQLLKRRKSIGRVHLSICDPILEEVLMDYQPVLKETCSFGICQLSQVAPDVYHQFSDAYAWYLSHYEFGLG
jgi:hypothetical protein